MGFLDHYVDKYKLDKISLENGRLKRLEEKIRRTINSAPTPVVFEDIIKQHGEKIADLVARVSAHFNEWQFSKIISSFKFVINIGTEVYQIVEDMQDSIITDGMSEEEKNIAKTELGKDLTYFVWMVVNPLKNKWKWLPFKGAIERWIVKWLAGMSLNAAMDYFKANIKIRVFSDNKDTKEEQVMYYKALR